jgi:hypothetical protein
VNVEVVVDSMYATIDAGVELVLDGIGGRDVMLEVGGTSIDLRACELSACFWTIEEVGACEVCSVTQGPRLCYSNGLNATFINHVLFLQRKGGNKDQECGEDVDAVRDAYLDEICRSRH